jgi:hypothetical protein
VSTCRTGKLDRYLELCCEGLYEATRRERSGLRLLPVGDEPPSRSFSVQSSRERVNIACLAA